VTVTPAHVDEGLWRELVPQALARLLRTYGRDQIDLCEDAVQDALVAAHQQWTVQAPEDPLAWLVTAARRRYIDRVRSDYRRRDRETREALLALPLNACSSESSAIDDSLLLLHLCCHPALPRSAQVALTLRAVAGLSTAQIANVYQLPEATVAQRITRAKRRIAELGGALPRPGDVTERLPSVLDVLYVMFTEAHHTTTGEPAHDADLAAEAIRLARQLHKALPLDTEVSGLLALMLLTEARRPARVGPDNRLIPLDEQDRRLWEPALIAEGRALVERAVVGATPGPYLLQACIAALHAEAPDTASTDWSEILALYRLLEVITENRNPTIALNRIVAEAMVHGEEYALACIDELAEHHPRLSRLAGVRAHLLERLGRDDEAVAAYRQAIKETRNIAEQAHLRARLRRLLRSPGAPSSHPVSDIEPSRRPTGVRRPWAGEATIASPRS
jgi:RNA polymerase sigma factor, sigma-70 family